MTIEETEDGEAIGPGAPSNVVDITTARGVRTDALPNASRLQPWEDELLERLLISISRSGARTLCATAANVATVLRLHPDWAGIIALNVFHMRMETTAVPPWHEIDAPSNPKPGPWSDGDTARLVNWFARTWICGMPPIQIKPPTVEAGLIISAQANEYHPVRSYLRGITFLQEVDGAAPLEVAGWDGEKRIDTWVANYLGGETTPYACAVGAAFLIGCVARVMQPGCKLDTMIVLEGKQGKYKSTALEVLAGEWFADSRLAIGEKDAMQGLCGVWIYELGELASLRKADVETIKLFMSSRSDHYRPSYGKHAIDVPRQTAFAGSTNADQYLQDETGGRRFNPIKTDVINIAALRRDRDQLWAEALHRYEDGAPWWVDEGITAPEQEARLVVDEWQDRIEVYLRLRTTTKVGDILDDLIFRDVDKDGNARNTLGRWGQTEQSRVARCLIRLGWIKKRERDGARKMFYARPHAWPIITASAVPLPDGTDITSP